VKILLDECMPLPILARLADLGHTLQHAARCGLAGCTNGDVYDHAIAEFDLFITNDRHFRNTNRFPVSGELGIVFVRIAPCVTDLVAPRFVGYSLKSPSSLWQDVESSCTATDGNSSSETIRW
jgi:predicted nuclease of predicted toxin-antitoxin system